AQAAGADASGAGIAATNAEADLAQLVLDPDARDLLEQAMDRLRLSPRGYTRVLRVGRTIADLAEAPAIGRAHVAEALAYRHRQHGRR
ncbi:magnesium chelatase subunit ChlI family protein, partial [Acidisphaera rubrifaciens]